MTTKLSLVFTFYRRFIVMASIATLLIAFIQPTGSYNGMFTIKMWISAGFIAITHFTYGNEYYYYRNLGVRPRWLWTGSCLIDMLIFVIVSLFVSMFAA